MSDLAGIARAASRNLAVFTRKPRRWPRLAVAGVAGVTLVLSLQGQSVEAAAAYRQLTADADFTPKREKSVPVQTAKIQPRQADPAEQQALTKPHPVTWPAAGTAEVSVPQARSVDWSAVVTGKPAARPLAKAGPLPIEVGPAVPSSAAAKSAGATPPAKVSVDLLGRRGDAVAFRIKRTDGVAKSGAVGIAFDYSDFQHAYGADWNSRLRVVSLPECGLTTPAKTECAGTPVATRNDGSGKLTADLTTGGLYALQAAAAGPGGDFQATSLAPSATWQAGGSSGDFNWQYPLEVPPAVGPSIDLAVEYSSGSVDGRTTATNNQPSWLGEGFDFTPGGSIERRYASCGAKSEQTGTNGTKPTGDLCWATDNAMMTLNGKGGELVRDDATGTWKSRSDDGSKIERITDTSKNNGDNDGEYWVITSADGTKYYFGLNRLPGWVTGKEETRSTQSVPVFGNHSGEPCYNVSFASGHCKQAYKWNLDYVVDKHGNTMSFFYDIENNYYARFMTATAVSQYDRAGSLRRIDYGQRDGEVYTTDPIARVRFTTAERCISTCSTATPSTYPDTPLDQACTSSTNCSNKFNPTFWTTKRLASVTTQIKRPTGFDDVDVWTFRHSYPSPGDGTRPGLWLDGITNTGVVGPGSSSIAEINFDGVQLPNRVAGTDGLPTMNWWRIRNVHYGTGGVITVNYSEQDCSLPGNVPAPDTNGKRCHPVRWTPENQVERQDWFNKYVVTSVTESDRVSGLEPVVTKYDYLTPPAWRHDEEDGLVEIGRKTWSQWRGYEHVRTTKGVAGGPQTVTEQRYFRGMDGDKKADGSVKDVKIKDSTGTELEDVNPLAGQLREELAFADGKIVDRTLSEQWVSAPRATRVKPWGTVQAFQVEDRGMRQDEANGTGWRSRSATNTYTTDGRLVEKNELNDLSKADDDSCTKFTFSDNAAAGLREVPVREQTIAKACGQSFTKEDVIVDQRFSYDGNARPEDPATKGNLTRIDQVASYDANGNPVYKTAWQAKYDTAGRQISVTDATGETKQSFSPATGPVTETVVTQPNGHTVKTVLEPAWGEPVSVTAPDGLTTEKEYDPLGRVTKAWAPGQSKSSTPAFAYEYKAEGDAAGTVTTKTLQADGSVESTIELLDGLLRPRQLQEPAPGGGRVITDYIYDSRGQVLKENGPYFNDASVGDTVVLPDETALPHQKVSVYDTQGQVTSEITYSEGQKKTETKYVHGAGIQTIIPPTGEQPTTRITDVQGRLLELRQADGSGGHDSTFYTYHPAGQLATVKDPAGNVWSFDYDLLGRKIKESDPDKGVTTYTYDDADRLATSKDSRGVTLAFGYDSIGRRTAVHEGSLSGPKRAEWTYDSLAKGTPTSSTRYVNGNAYTTKVLGYDPGGRPLGMEVTLPASEGALAGTYKVENTYNADGELKTSKLPGVGGLPAETLEYGYNAQDLPTTLKGATSYVTGTTYTPYGDLDTVTMAQDGGKWIQRKYEYETGTRRLTRVVTDRETLPRRISSVSYDYDAAGNVKRIQDTPSSTGTEPIDTQCFKYDHLRRLTSAWTPADADCEAAPSTANLGGPAPYWQSWAFDKVGNRKTQSKHTAAGTTTSTYEYPAAGQQQPHAVQKVTTTGPGGTTTDSYGYDATGNQIQRSLAGTGETFTWDAEGKLEKVVKGGSTTSFVYDADGNRMLRRDGSGTTFYFGETELQLTPAGQVTGTRYYSHGGRTIAVRTGDKVTWLGNDHHGTPELAIDAASQAVQRRRHTPYGESRGAAPAAWPGQKGFVGGTNDPSTGLVHLDAREYDPTIGRFISVDPMADYEDAQQLNGFAYGNNNPVTYSDPDGRLFWIPLIIAAIRIIPVVIRVVQVVRTAVQVTTPVVRAIPTVVNTGTRVINTVRNVTTHVPRIINTVKKVEKVVKQIQRVTTKVKKNVKVNGPKKTTPKNAAKKPSSAAKQQTKKDVKNTSTNQKPQAKKPQQQQQQPKQQQKQRKPDRDKDGGDDDEEETVTVYRIEGKPNTRIDIDADGNVSVRGKQNLYLNFGDKVRADRYLKQKIADGLPGAKLKSFKVKKSYYDDLVSRAKPQAGGKGAPVQHVDTTKTGTSYGLRFSEFGKLIANVIPRSGRQ